MEIEKAIKIMKIEQECVRRQETNLCNRDECGCQCCDLIQDTADVLAAYDTAIDCLKFSNKFIDSVVNCMDILGCETFDDFQKYLKEMAGDKDG